MVTILKALNFGVKFVKKLAILSIVALISGCSSLYDSNAEKNYLRSKNGPRLDIEAPLTDSNISVFYLLPSVTGNANVSTEPPVKG